jgi:hypothetical protein
MKRFIVVVLIAVLLSAQINAVDSKAVSLGSSTSRYTLQNGSTLKINVYFYYGSEKPKWSTSNKNIKITSKGKTWCKIKAKKAGNSYVKCKIGKKTYKKKITVKAKSKITYSYYSAIDYGMTIDEVRKLLGERGTVYSSKTNSDEEYNQYLEWQTEDGGGWEDSLYYEQVVYEWTNPWTYSRIYCTFNDGVLISKKYY